MRRKDRVLGEFPDSVPKWVVEDFHDMMDWNMFWRCTKCGQVSPEGYRCVSCAHDPTAAVEEEPDAEEQG